MSQSVTELPQPKAGILDLAPYVPGKAAGASGQKVYRLASNENALGASPIALKAFEACAGDMDRYPDPACQLLVSALSAEYGYEASQLICGAGSDELISLLIRAYAGAGDEVLFNVPGFLMYQVATKAAGATPVAVATDGDLRADIDQMLAHVTDKTRLVFLDNPNNPAGTVVPWEEVIRLHQGLRSDIILVLDSAYAEYATSDTYRAGAELVDNAQNVIMLRTFSKAYGLANLRIGWGYGPHHMIDILHRIRAPFNVTGPAQKMAVAALKDKSHLINSIRENTSLIAHVRAELQKLGLWVSESEGNFVLIRLGSPARLASLSDFLTENGILTRALTGWGVADGLRLTMGRPEDMDFVLAKIAEWQKAL